MTQVKIQTSAEMVRAYAAASGTMRKKEAEAALGLTVDQVKCAVETLCRQGYLRRIKHGLYQAVDKVERPVGSVEERIWRAMKVSARFSAADIAKLSRARLPYVYRKFREWRADSFIKQSGVRGTYPIGQEKLWRLTVKGKEKAQAPAEYEYEPDPLVMATVNLNRLICSGLAVRDANAAREAINLMQVIMAAMEGILDEG
jgi:hypothetical protein